MTTIDVSTNSDHPIIYLAVGIPQGIIWVDEQPEEESLGNVRNGRTTVHFPLDSFEYWIRALDGVTLDTLREVAAKQDDLDDFADNLAFMVESKLLLPWSCTEKDIELFQDLRIIPTSVGVGNSSDEPTKFLICSRNDAQTLVQTDFVSYAIWSYCDGISSLEQACQSVSEHFSVPIDEVRRLALTLVPTLMRYGAALLDLVFPQEIEID